MFYCLTVLCSGYIEPISRRLVNLAYITWIVRPINTKTLCLINSSPLQFSYGALIVGLFLLTDVIVSTLSHTSQVPRPHSLHSASVCLISAVDYNQLGFFLLANLFTGLVNFSMDTLSVSWTTGLVILLAYMAVLSFVFCTLYKFNIKIKL